jgi:nitroreductase
MDYETLLELVKNRRTIRRFKPDPVPDEYVTRILEVARWAPSGFNMQPWEFVVVKDPEIKAAMLRLLDDYRTLIGKIESVREPWQRVPKAPYRDPEMDFHNAPVFILVMGDTRIQTGLPMMVRYEMERKQTIYTSSLANAYLYMCLAATTLGLASEWVSSIGSPYPHALVKDLLGIPPHFEIYDMMALGYGAVKSRPKLIRKLSEMVHYDHCSENDFRTSEEIKEFIKKVRIWVTANHRRGIDRVKDDA